MKNFYPLIIIIVFAYAACKKNDIDGNKPNITVCDVHNPEWLLNEIDKIRNHVYPMFRAVQVYSIKYDEQEYLLVDM
jgi:hypothetical protein